MKNFHELIEKLKALHKLQPENLELDKTLKIQLQAKRSPMLVAISNGMDTLEKTINNLANNYKPVGASPEEEIAALKFTTLVKIIVNHYFWLLNKKVVFLGISDKLKPLKKYLDTYRQFIEDNLGIKDLPTFEQLKDGFELVLLFNGNKSEDVDNIQLDVIEQWQWRGRYTFGHTDKDKVTPLTTASTTDDYKTQVRQACPTTKHTLPSSAADETKATPEGPVTPKESVTPTRKHKLDNLYSSLPHADSPRGSKSPKGAPGGTFASPNPLEHTSLPDEKTAYEIVAFDFDGTLRAFNSENAIAIALAGLDEIVNDIKRDTPPFPDLPPQFLAAAQKKFPKDPVDEAALLAALNHALPIIKQKKETFGYPKFLTDPQSKEILAEADVDLDFQKAATQHLKFNGSEKSKENLKKLFQHFNSSNGKKVIIVTKTKPHYVENIKAFLVKEGIVAETDIGNVTIIVSQVRTNPAMKKDDKQAHHIVAMMAFYAEQPSSQQPKKLGDRRIKYTLLDDKEKYTQATTDKLYDDTIIADVRKALRIDEPNADLTNKDYAMAAMKKLHPKWFAQQSSFLWIELSGKPSDSTENRAAREDKIFNEHIDSFIKEMVDYAKKHATYSGIPVMDRVANKLAGDPDPFEALWQQTSDYIDYGNHSATASRSFGH